MSPTLIGSLLAALLTVMVFSYLLGNNPLYRMAQHIFVGVSIGYATLLLIGSVLVPQVSAFGKNPGSLTAWLTGLPILLGVFLLFRLLRPPGTENRPMSLPLRGAFGIGALALNIAVSTAAALAIGGALSGTLVPQLADSMRPINGDATQVVGNLVLVLGVAAALYYFQFSARPGGTRSTTGTAIAGVGKLLILIALGATLGSLTVSFVAALVERVAFLFHIPSLF